MFDFYWREVRWRLHECLACSAMMFLAALVFVGGLVVEAWYCVARWIEDEGEDS